MNFDIFKKIPILAKETKEKVSKAITNLQYDEASFFFNDGSTRDVILKDLNSKYESENLNAVKKIIALFLSGKDVSIFIPKLIQKLPSENNEIKRLCQYFLVEESSKDHNKDSLLMCIQPLHKEILSQQIILRGDAFKTLSSLKISEISAVLSQTLNKIIIDKSAYVRKIACNGLYKLYRLNNQNCDQSEIEHFLKYLMKDICFVKGTALKIFYLMKNQNDYSFLHPYFKKICSELHQYSSHDLVYILKILHAYVFIYIAHSPKAETILPAKGPKKEKKETESQISDLELFLINCEKLLRSSYPEVVLEVANVFLEFAKKDRIAKVAKSMLRFLNMSSETKYILLQMMKKIATHHPECLRDRYQSFFVVNMEKSYCKLIKIEILYHLTDESNLNAILEELYYYTRSPNQKIASLSIRTIGNLALKGGRFLTKSTKILLALFKSHSVELIDEVIISLTRIITNDLKKNLPILIYCLKLVPSISNPKPRSNIISLISEIIELIPNLAAEFLRVLTLKFKEECEDIKIQILNLNMEMLIKTSPDFSHKKFIQTNFLYILSLALFDSSILVRDNGRIKKNLLILFRENRTEEEDKILKDNIMNYSSENFDQFKEYLKNNKIDISNDYLKKNEESSKIIEVTSEESAFEIGTFSYLINFQLPNCRYPPSSNQIHLENTDKLRENEEFITINQKTEIPSKVTEKEDKPKTIHNENIENKIDESIKQSLKIDEHYQQQNLHSALDEFFSSEEDEDEEEEEEEGDGK